MVECTVSAGAKKDLGVKVLIVEDYCDCRELMAFMLNTAGFSVIEAASGEESIDKAKSERPDLIIMDLTLPGINGIETTTRLKLDPATADIPVIAFTAWNERDYKRHAVNAGVAKFLVKPISYVRLIEVLKDFAGRSL